MFEWKENRLKYKTGFCNRVLTKKSFTNNFFTKFTRKYKKKKEKMVMIFFLSIQTRLRIKFFFFLKFFYFVFLSKSIKPNRALTKAPTAMPIKKMKLNTLQY